MHRIRNNNDSTSGTSPESSATIQGSADEQETFVEVQWGWIAALIILLVGSVLFILAAIISSSGLGWRQEPGIWKSSSLPLLKALNAELHQEGFSGMRTLSAMEEWARDVPVRLSRDVDGNGYGWTLVRRWSEEGKPESQEL